MIILVTTCFKYRHIWPISTALLDKYWGDCEWPIIFLTDGKEEDCPEGFFCLDQDLGWSSNLIKFLKQHQGNQVFLTVEDLLLRGPVDNRMIAKASEYIDQHGLGCVRLEPYHRQTKFGLQDWLDEDFGIINPKDNYSVTGQPTLWDKDTLLQLLVDGEDAWDFEIKGSARSCNLNKSLISLRLGKKRVFPYTYGLKRNKYKPDAVELIKREGLVAYIQEEHL